MAITGAQLAADAMFQAGVLGQDGFVNPQGDADVALVLRRLNRLLDSFSTEQLMIYAPSTETITLTAGVASYSTTLLAGGRPTGIMNAFVSYGGIDYALELIDQTAYDAIPLKTIAAIPQYLYFDTTFPNGTLYLFPTPSGATTLTVECMRVLNPAQITSSTSVTFPPGYEKVLVDCLAEDICPSFGIPVSPDVAKAASQARAKLKAMNYTPREANVELGQVPWEVWAFQCRLW